MRLAPGCIGLLAVGFVAFLTLRYPAPPQEAVPAASNLFIYSFNAPGVLQEAEEASSSSSQYWFLDSGGALTIGNGTGATVQGALSERDPWRDIYAESNPIDSDDGFHPQNIFRLLTRSRWSDASTEVEARVVRDNLSASPNRNASNGILLMSRYQDQETLYYAGIRVDGSAVIKKKYKGVYFTLAQAPAFSGLYDHTSRPNVLPHGTWIGLRSTALTNPNGSVTLSLALGNGVQWRVLSATDDGSHEGTPPIIEAGASGIRTDFMDVEFRNFRILGRDRAGGGMSVPEARSAPDVE